MTAEMPILKIGYNSSFERSDMNKKRFFLYFITVLAATALIFLLKYQPEIPGIRVNDPELTRLITIMEKYRKEPIEIVWEGSQSTPAAFWIFAKDFLRRNYRLGDSPEEWIQTHCYRTTEGSIIYFKFSDGTTRPMRDVFLEELAVLRKN